MSKEKIDYLRTLYTQYSAMLDVLNKAIHFSKRTHPEQYEDPEGSVSFLTYIKSFIWHIEQTELLIRKAVDTIKEGLDKHNYPIAKDAKITIATIFRLNHKIKKPSLKLKESFLEEQNEDFWGGEDFLLGCLYSDAMKLQEQHSLIEQFIKDLLITETRILIEIKSVKTRRLKRTEAELIVKQILDDYPENNWNTRSMAEYLLDELNLQYSYVSVSKLNAYKAWDKKHSQRKPGFMELTSRRLQSIDSTGKAHFSRDKKSSNYSKEDD